MRASIFALLVVWCASAFGAPPREDSLGRRAVRGLPVITAHESDELRQMRALDAEVAPPPLPSAEGGLYEPVAVGASASASAANGDKFDPDALLRSLRAPGIAPETDAAAMPPWLAGLRLPDLPVRMDAHVLHYLELYKSDPRARAIMRSWLRNQGRYQKLIERALARAHLPRALEYVSMIESGFDPHDRSGAGAVGLWQFMPEGGRIYGLRIDYWVDQRRDPERSTLAAMHYLSDLKERFGDWPLALAAFNAGYGAVMRAMAKYNTNDYWDLCSHEDGLPWDTTLYVPKIMAAALVGQNRRVFGYADLPTAPPYAYDKVVVPESMSFAAMAKAAGVSTSDIAALNPELLRGRTPPERWVARVPRGSGRTFALAYQTDREALRPVAVRFGERLDELAHTYGLSVKAFRALNGIDDSTEVRPGLTLLVPSERTRRAPPTCDFTIVAVKHPGVTVAGRRRIFYRTLSTDRIQELADFFHVTPSELQLWNDLDLHARLAANMVLQVWVKPSFDESQVVLVDPAHVRVVTTGSEEFFDLIEAQRGRKRITYVARRHDTLKRIGHRFGLTVADLERINRFHRGPLAVGQRLTVYVPMSKRERERAACMLIPGGALSASAETGSDDDNDREPEVSAPRGLPAPPPADGLP